MHYDGKLQRYAVINWASFKTTSKPYFPHKLPQFEDVKRARSFSNVFDVASKKSIAWCPYNAAFFPFSLPFFHFFVFLLLFSPHSEIWNRMINQYSYAVELIPVGNATITIFSFFCCIELLLQLKRILQENKNRSTASIKLLNDENT